MRKPRHDNPDTLRCSIPELEDWPIRPIKPGVIIDHGRLDDGLPDGGTLYVVLAGVGGVNIVMFFEGFLGRLCHGDPSGKNPEYSYLRPGSKIETEAFIRIESGARRDPPMEEVLACLDDARLNSRYSRL